MPHDAEESSSLERHSLVTLVVLATIAFIAVLTPFYGAVMWGAIIALVFLPLHRWLLRKWKGRENWAAIATMLIVVLMVILPLMGLMGSLVQEGARLVERLQSGDLNFATYVERIVGALPRPIVDLLERFGLADMASIQGRIGEYAGRASQFFATQALSFGQDTLNVLVGFFVALYIAFFMLRDGRHIARLVHDHVPLRDSDKRRLGSMFATVVKATVKGNVVVAIVQGILGGIALWFLGIHGALLWGTVMAFLSLLPAVGAALVWLPIALYLLATGDIVQGVGLIAYGVLVIGLVDNVLRPLLVGKDTKLPDWLVLISTIGGMALFGINGFVIGPVVAASFIAVWGIFGQRHRVDGEAEASAEATRTDGQRKG